MPGEMSLLDAAGVLGARPAPVERPRIALYSPDSYGLGHFRRNRRIAEALLHAMPEATVLLLTGCPAADRYPALPRADIVRLPAAVWGPEGTYRARTLGVEPRHLTEMRAAILQGALSTFDPDILIVDHNPGGRDGELRGALDTLRTRGRTRLIAWGIRDIWDEPARIRDRWARDGSFELIAGVYDEVWVFGPREVFDPVVEYGVPTLLAPRFHHLGYLIDEPPRRRARRRDHVPLVVVTGGGGEDAFPLLQATLQARRQSQVRFRVDVLAGPLMPSRERHQLEAEAALVGRDAKVRTFHPRPRGLMAGADAVVTMGGYNSLLECLSVGVPSLVVPRPWHAEPLIRARRMSERGWTSHLPPDQLSPGSIEAAIVRLLRSGAQVAVPPEFLGGLAAVVERCRAAMAATPVLAPGREPATR